MIWWEVTWGLWVWFLISNIGVDDSTHVVGGPEDEQGRPVGAQSERPGVKWAPSMGQLRSLSQGSWSR